MNRTILEPILRRALLEDIGKGGDITTDAIVPVDATAHGVFVAREAGVLAGIEAAALTFELLSPNGFDFIPKKRDGDALSADDIIAEVRGNARALLTGERTALNILTHLSGIATLTRSYVEEVEGTQAHIVDTRKTLPGLRALEKYAVRCGGGSNHRFGLDDAVLIKDNHLAVAGSIHAAVVSARAHAGHMMKLEIEVDTLDQLREALREPIDAVLLDNMPASKLSEAIQIVRASGKPVLTEASGSISLKNLREVAESGVSLISVGRLTHSAPALDIGLDLSL